MSNLLPDLGHIDVSHKVEVPEPLDRAHYEKKGNHIFIGQRKSRGSSDALIYLGKCIETSRIGNRFDANVWFDVRTPHVVYIVGKRGSGKSYDLGILSEGLLLGRLTKITSKDKAITTIIFDTQDQFWSLGSPPREDATADREQLADMHRWNLGPAAVNDAIILNPRGVPSDLPTAAEFSINPADLSIDDWCRLLGEERYTSIGQTIETLLEKVSRTGYTRQGGGGAVASGSRVAPKQQFEIADVLACLRDDQDLNATTALQTRNAVLWRLNGLSNTSLFTSNSTNVKGSLTPGRLTVLLLRKLDNATKAIVVSVVAKQIFTLMGEFHTAKKVSRRLGTKLSDNYDGLPEGAWIIIDEAHLVCPADRDTSAKQILLEYVKRGWDAGLSLVLATQQPSAIDSRVLSQVDLMIAHRLVMESDISAALARMPATFPTKVIVGGQEVTGPSALIRMLDTREAWVGDAETSRAFLLSMRPRITAHGGDEPALV